LSWPPGDVIVRCVSWHVVSGRSCMVYIVQLRAENLSNEQVHLPVNGKQKNAVDEGIPIDECKTCRDPGIGKVRALSFREWESAGSEGDASKSDGFASSLYDPDSALTSATTAREMRSLIPTWGYRYHARPSSLRNGVQKRLYQT